MLIDLTIENQLKKGLWWAKHGHKFSGAPFIKRETLFPQCKSGLALWLNFDQENIREVTSGDFWMQPPDLAPSTLLLFPLDLKLPIKKPALASLSRKGYMEWETHQHPAPTTRLVSVAIWTTQVRLAEEQPTWSTESWGMINRCCFKQQTQIWFFVHSKR